MTAFQPLKNNLFDVPSFESALEEYVDYIFDTRYTIQPRVSVLCRSLDKREFQYSEFSSSSNSVDIGDVVIIPSISSERFKDSSLYVCLATLFEKDDLAESFLRKRVYDCVFSYSHAHKIDSASSIINPDPFDCGVTPSRRINFSSVNGDAFSREKIVAMLRKDYSCAVRYFSIIDSEEFQKKVSTIKSFTDDEISSLLKNEK